MWTNSPREECGGLFFKTSPCPANAGHNKETNSDWVGVVILARITPNENIDRRESLRPASKCQTVPYRISEINMCLGFFLVIFDKVCQNIYLELVLQISWVISNIPYL